MRGKTEEGEKAHLCRTNEGEGREYLMEKIRNNYESYCARKWTDAPEGIRIDGGKAHLRRTNEGGREHVMEKNIIKN